MRKEKLNTINFQNIQTTFTAQYKKQKKIKEMGRTPK